MDEQSLPANVDQATAILLGEAPDAPPEPEPEVQPDTAEDPVREVMEPEGDSPAPDVADSPEGQADAPEPPTTLAAAAERLGLEVDALYELAIPMGGDGSTATLSELKHMAQEQRDSVLEREAWAQEKADQVKELQDARRELQQIAAGLPRDALTPEAQQRAAAEWEATVEREKRALLEVVPEWKDQTRYESDRSDMLSHLERYGFNETDLENVVDHRLLAYLREMSAREKRLNAALERAQSARKPAAEKPRNARAKPQASAAAEKPGGRQAKVDAVTAILTGNES